jgi:hypothetical protein
MSGSKLGWNHPVCLICQYFMSGLKLLDGITLYVQLVSTSYLVQKFWIESPCMFNLSVFHVWFKTFVLNHPVCSTCQYLMSGTKLLDEITLYVQLVCSSCPIPNFWIESSCLFNLSVLVWFKTFGWNHPLCSTCQYFMSGSKLLDGITLYIQLVCSSCLVQNLDGITVYVQLVWFKTFGWNLPVCSVCQYFMPGSKLGLNHPVCSICQYFISGSKLLDGITLYVQVVKTSCLVQNFWMESPCMFKLSVLHVLFKTFGWKHPVSSACLLHIWLKNVGLNHPVCLICQYFMSGSKF